MSLSLGTLSGCGDDAKVGKIEDAPEAKKADDAGRKAMEDFMKSSGKQGAKGKAK